MPVPLETTALIGKAGRTSRIWAACGCQQRHMAETNSRTLQSRATDSMARERTGSKNAKLDQGTFVERQTSAHDRRRSVSWTLAVCARIMRPLIRLALSFGVKHAQLEALLRDLRSGS
jgi:hypothetical protein